MVYSTWYEGIALSIDNPPGSVSSGARLHDTSPAKLAPAPDDYLHRTNMLTIITPEVHSSSYLLLVAS